MPIFRNKRTAAQSFTGADATTGLFLLSQTGSSTIQIRINSLKFHTDGAAVAWQLRAVDPVDLDNEPLVLADTSADLTIEGSAAMTLAVESAGNPWGLKFTSAVLADDGWLVIDYDFMESEG